MDKVAKITGSVSVDKLNVEHLRRISEPVKKLVEAGLVLAIQQDQDGLRSSKISLENGKLYLHTLLYQPLSAHARTIQLSEVMDELDSSSTLAFLDLGWAGATRGRIHIRLRPNTGLARQFVLMCTGQQGPTYANTKLVSVGYKSRPGEYVAGGDYQYNDGRGGTPLLFDLLGEYRRSGSAGAVWSPRQLGDLSTQFCIITRDRTDGHQWGDVFGEVENGLDVLKAAVKLRNINEVTVVDCGLVLTL
ncbi:hypothetical protein OTU49_002520 [Cherax quadricarinatus]|uniref:PPIase cyclophilin-type domain-containing protein n=1 Tax=Cherax quadricarinatus TaxID=27406 RepID=A0AAW0XL53_CHEQU